MPPTLTEAPAGSGPVDVRITTRPAPVTEIVFVDDLETIVESEKCSCNAGDDNPY
jgi:hypothetical protein